MDRDKILNRLDIQLEIEGDFEKVSLLKNFLKKIKWKSQWDSFVIIREHRYGFLSYECHIFYDPTEDLYNIMSN